jgi:hypothetical protein
MSLDLYRTEVSEDLSQREGTRDVAPGVMQNFLPGAGKVAMREFAKAGRAISMAGAVFPIAYDKLTGGGTTFQPVDGQQADGHTKAVRGARGSAA